MDVITTMVIYFIMVFAAKNGLLPLSLGLLVFILISNKFDKYMFVASAVGIMIFLIESYIPSAPDWITLVALFVVLVVLNKKHEKEEKLLTEAGMLRPGGY